MNASIYFNVILLFLIFGFSYEYILLNVARTPLGDGLHRTLQTNVTLLIENINETRCSLYFR